MSALSDMHPVNGVTVKLRRALSLLLGAGGQGSLIERALTLARQECPALYAWKANADGSLEGLSGDGAEPSTVFIAQLLGLLMTFVGEAFTLQLLENVWPDLNWSDVRLERCETK